MKIKVVREKSNSDTTIGRLFIDDIFECFTLEDEYRTKKVWGETRIPAGTYQIKFRKEGGFHNKYSERFETFHVGMLHIQDVPGFKFVLIHIGNDDDDTAGCLLVGQRVEGWRIVNSTDAYTQLYKQVAAALLVHEEVEIEYIDDDLS